MIVTPDASVLLKWVLPGDDEQAADAALLLRDEAVAGAIDLVVPQLWIYEVGNTLAGRFPNDADELLASLADFGLRDWAAECTDTPQMTASGLTERTGGVESNK